MWKDSEVQKALRQLSKDTDANLMVKLPDCKFSEFEDEVHHFEDVNLAKLLHFIADLMFCLLVLVLVGGCGTLTHGPYQDVYVTSNPPGATITPTDYKCWIKTPGFIRLERANSTTLKAKLLGYETQKKKLQVHISPFLLGNGAGSFYTVQTFTARNIPGCELLFIGDCVTGSVGYLTPGSVHFELEPVKKRVRRD